MLPCPAERWGRDDGWETGRQDLQPVAPDGRGLSGAGAQHPHPPLGSPCRKAVSERSMPPLPPRLRRGASLAAAAAAFVPLVGRGAAWSAPLSAAPGASTSRTASTAMAGSSGPGEGGAGVTAPQALGGAGCPRSSEWELRQAQRLQQCVETRFFGASDLPSPMPRTQACCGVNRCSNRLAQSCSSHQSSRCGFSGSRQVRTHWGLGTGPQADHVPGQLTEYIELVTRPD